MKKVLAMRTLSFLCAFVMTIQLASPALATANTDKESETSADTTQITSSTEETLAVGSAQTEPELQAAENLPKEGEDRIQAATDNRIKWSSGWNVWTGESNGQHTRYANSVGETATVSFEGTGIALYGKKAFNGPIVTAKVDNLDPVDVDFFGEGSKGNQQKIWEINNLPAGSHTLVLTITNRHNESAHASANNQFQAEISYLVPSYNATPEPGPTPPETPAEGKLWYKLQGGSRNNNSHNYGDASKPAPVLALDKSHTMDVGKPVSMTIKPSNNFAMFYTYVDDNNWLYVGYDSTSKWYYQYKINGSERYSSVGDLPTPVVGEAMTMSLTLDRETLTVSVNGTKKQMSLPALLPFTTDEALKNTGHFGIKTSPNVLFFTDATMDGRDCMKDQWQFAAQREGQILEQHRATLRDLTGTVTDAENQPIKDAKVLVGGKNATTNAEGKFTVKGLEPGKYTIAVTADGMAPYSQDITIADNDNNQLNISMEAKEEQDLSDFDVLQNDQMKVYIGREFPVIARYEMIKQEGTPFFRANENAAALKTLKINGIDVTPEVKAGDITNNTSRVYTLTIKDDANKLNLTMDVTVSIKENTLTWQITKLTKGDGCNPIATIQVPELNLLTVDSSEQDARFDGAQASSNTTVSGDRSYTFDDGFTPNADDGFLYGFLSNGKLSAGLESNSEIEGDKRVILHNGASTMSLNSATWYYERGDINGQKRNLKYPTSELPIVKVAIGADENKDGSIDWNDGALAYRKIMHRAYGSDVVKDMVNHRIVMNFASMAPDPFLATADNLKKVFLATDGLPQALLLKGYGNEGHDSANSEYADIAEREGGVEDFRKLLEIAHKYNTEIGIHINAQEAYPESKSFNPNMIGGFNGSGNGWGWLDQSHVIDKLWDLSSDARWKRLVQLYDRINQTNHLSLDWEKGEYVLDSQGTVNPGFTSATFDALNTLRREAENFEHNMDFIYLDVWYQDSWETRQVAKQINSLGWRFTTEFSTQGEYDSTWQHWSTDAPYGGKESKGFNSDIIRFIRNDQRDSQVLNHPAYGGTADNPLLGGFELYGFEGWGSQRDFGDYIKGTFNTNLPTKFLQHYIVTDWENYEDGQSPVANHEKQITLHNENGDKVVVTRNEAQRSDNNIERTITLQKKGQANPVTVLDTTKDSMKYLLPWTDNQDNTEKLYHWNLEGGTSTWTLPAGWENLANVTMYRLTDQGRVDEKVIPVNGGKITITAEAAAPYILVKTAGIKELESDFGEMDYVTDPGFNGYAGNGSKLDPKDWTGDITDSSITVELTETEDQRLQFASPDKDVAVSTTIRGLTPGENYVAEIYVQNDTNLPATLEVNNGVETVSVWAGHSYVKNYVRCDNKSAYSSMQRMQVSFVAKSETATLTLKRAAGEGNTYMDSIRIVHQTLNNYREDGSFVQDFESVVQGLYPFVLGPAQGVDDPRTHLSQLHAPYTQYGWNDRVVDDVIEGNWSLKHHSQSTGIIYQTLPQNFRFEPGKYYTVEFDYQTGSDRAYAMVVGDDEVFYKPTASQLLPVTGGKEVDGKVVGNTQHYEMVVKGSESGNTWIGLYSPGGVAGGAFGQMDFILDNLVIKETTDAVTVEISSNNLFKGETAQVNVFSVSPNGGVTKWESTDSNVAVVENNQVKALNKGTATLTATLTNGKTQSFVVTVIDESTMGIPGVGATANTEERGGEGPVSGYANAAADGDSATFWHSQWSNGSFRVSETNPAVITVDLGSAMSINGFKIQQRTSGGGNGMVQKFSYRILGADKSTVLKDGTVNVPRAEQEIGKWHEEMFTEALQDARYIEISVLSGNGGFAALSEIQAIRHVKVADNAAMSDLTLASGDVQPMDLKPVGGNDLILTGIVWSVKDASIASVDQEGNVTGILPGTTTVTASNAAGLTVSAQVTVTGNDVSIKSVELVAESNTEKTVAQAEDYDLTGLQVKLTLSNDKSVIISGNAIKTLPGYAVTIGEDNHLVIHVMDTALVTNITVITEPDNPDKPTDPDPSEPTDPDPSEPTKPTEPVDPSKPTEPADPSKPTKPTEPAKPSTTPTTGNNFPLAVLSLAAVTSLAGAAVIIANKKKR